MTSAVNNTGNVTTTFPSHGVPRISLHRGSGLNDDLISTPSRTFGTPAPKTTWKSLKTMPSDISEFAIDPAVFTDTKEIPVVKDEDRVDLFQRTLVSLRAEMPHKGFGAQEIKHLVKLNADRTCMEILPVLESELKKSSDAEFHNAAASSMLALFRAMIRARNAPRIRHIIEFTKQALTAYEDAELVACWLESMEGIMDLLSPKDAAAHLMPIIIDMSDVKKSPLSKKAAIILVRKLLQGSSEPRVWQSIWDLQRQQMLDSDGTVRAAATTLSADLAKKLEASQVAVLVSEIVRSAEDKETVVQAGVIDAIGKMCTSGRLDKRSCEIVIKLVKHILHDAFVHKPPNVAVLIHLAKFVPIVAETCSANEALSEEDKVWLLDAFIELCHYDVVSRLGAAVAFEMPPGFVSYRNKVGTAGLTGPSALLSSLAKASNAHAKGRISVNKAGAQTGKPVENNNPEVESWMVRAHCAANFLHFATFAKPLIDFKGGVYNVLNDLFHDPHPNVRKNIAAHLLALMELGGDQAGLCKDELVKALSDDNVDVIEALIPQLASIMKILVKTQVVSPDSNTAALPEIGGVLLFCEERLSQTRDWRVHSSLLLQLVVLPFCIPCDYIYQNFVPILLHRIIHLSQLPSRLGAAEALVSALRHSRRAAQRDDIRKKIRGFAHSRRAQDRMLYLYMSNMIMDRFSRKYFREHFFDTTLGLTDDIVSNVRAKTVRMLPKMRDKATDDTSAKKLEEVLGKVTRSENDKDALEAINAAVEEIQRLQQKKVKPDQEDEKKEIEEQYVASLESKMAKIEHKKLSGEPKQMTRGHEKHMYAPAVKITPAPEHAKAKGSDGPPTDPAKRSPSGLVGFYGGPQDSKNIVPLAKGKSKMLALTPEDSSSRTTARR